MRRRGAGVVVSDAARELVARWAVAVGWSGPALPSEWLALTETRLRDVGPETLERALRALPSSPWHNEPARRGWAKLPGYVLRNADRVLSLADGGETPRRQGTTGAGGAPSRVGPKLVRTPPPAVPGAQLAGAKALLEELDRPATKERR